MAIGLGRVFGFEFKENFLYPYAATSLKEFWRRWHVSLSTWFKEYLYIPLGGNRHSRLRTAFNKVIVFLLTGLWHGASWTFVIWGLFHGVFLLLEDYKIIPVEKIWRPLRHLYTVLVVLLAFVLFRADSFAQAIAMFQAMLLGFAPMSAGSPAALLIAELATPATLVILPLALLLSLPIVPALRGRLAAAEHSWPLTVCRLAGAVAVFIICLLSLSTSAYNPFIYFRF
jgi:alginate O-acetyltransferase complex protein AlgI